MLHEVILPKVGVYLNDVRLNEWLVEEGEEVGVGDPIISMDTDKVSVEVTAEFAGWLHQTSPAGSDHPIGSQVGTIATTRAEYEALLAEQGTA